MESSDIKIVRMATYKGWQAHFPKSYCDCEYWLYMLMYWTGKKDSPVPFWLNKGQFMQCMTTFQFSLVDTMHTIVPNFIFAFN